MPNTMNPAPTQTPDVGIDAIVPMPATPGKCWRVYWLAWSYDSAPSSGAIKFSWDDPDDGHFQMTLAVTSAGPGELNWDMNNPLYFPSGVSVDLRLVTGGASVTGTLYAGAVCQ